MKRTPKRLTVERLKQVLSYNPDTGAMTWLVNRGGRKSGTRAGHIMDHGYRIVGVDGEMLLTSTLAVLYMTGAYPASEVDHRDLDKANDAWDNLRETIPAFNCMNRRVRSDSQTGIKGVEKRGRRWRAKLHNKPVGTFDTPEEAKAAYMAAAVAYAGQFARGD